MCATAKSFCPEVCFKDDRGRPLATSCIIHLPRKTAPDGGADNRAVTPVQLELTASASTSGDLLPVRSVMAIPASTAATTAAQLPVVASPLPVAISQLPGAPMDYKAAGEQQEGNAQDAPMCGDDVMSMFTNLDSTNAAVPLRPEPSAPSSAAGADTVSAAHMCHYDMNVHGGMNVHGALLARGETFKMSGSPMWTVVSDARLKEIVGDWTLGIDEVTHLDGCPCPMRVA